LCMCVSFCLFVCVCACVPVAFGSRPRLQESRFRSRLPWIPWNFWPCLKATLGSLHFLLAMDLDTLELLALLAPPSQSGPSGLSVRSSASAGPSFSSFEPFEQSTGGDGDGDGAAKPSVAKIIDVEADAVTEFEDRPALGLLGEDLNLYRLNDHPEEERHFHRHRSRSPVQLSHRPILPLAETLHGRTARSSASSTLASRRPLPLHMNVGIGSGVSFGAACWEAVVGRPREATSFRGGARCLRTSDVQTGVDRVCRLCTTLVKRQSKFYIGISQDPEARWAQHLSARRHLWQHMHIVIEAPSSLVTGEIEVRVLRRFRGHQLCTNWGPGGETLTGGVPHFVYVLEA